MTVTSTGPPRPSRRHQDVGHWSLRRRLALIFVGAGVLVVVAAAVAAVALARLDDAVHRSLDRLDPANAAVLDFYGGMLDQETGVRGYALTHDSAYLAPYRQGRAAAAQAVATAHSELVGESGLLAALQRTEQAALAWQRDYAEPALARVQAGQPVAAASTADGKARFDRLRANFRDLRSALATERAAAERELRSATVTRSVASGGALFVILAVSVIVVLGLRRWVTDPIARLARETREVAGGAIDRPLSVTGPSEIVSLASDVEFMRRRLQEQVVAARDLQRAAEEAQAQVSEQAAALQRSNSELEQFAYVASHDLQEPLRKVASFCQLLEQRYADSLDDRARTYIGFAVDGAKRMQRLINDLLSFSRAGRTSAGLVEVELEAVLRRACSDLSAAIKEAGATVTADPLPTVVGDESLLTQLLVNLIGNGIKFRGSAPPRVHLSCREVDDAWQLCCTDNGIGIEPQYEEKIFVIFQRLHPKDAYGGTGIGLALCKKIVEYHGGRIWLDTDRAPDSGTRICFTLPIDRTERTTT